MGKRRDVEIASAAEDTVRSSGRSVLAVIGIDRYTGWQRLTNAVSDARGVVALFRRLGFEEVTEPLFDEQATGKALHELVTDDLRTLGPDDSLVLFYAGHGATRNHHLGGQVVKTGYLIPVDASQRAATWIELDAWLRAISLLPAKHILVILDACHSGIALGSVIKWRDTGTWQDTPLSTLNARRSRRIITSALDDQLALDGGPVHGHSLFTGCLIEGLTHGLGRSGIRVTTGSELGMYLQRRVEAYPNSWQTPDFGTFDFDDRGELVIPLVVERSVSESTSAQRVNAVPPPLRPLTLTTAEAERTTLRRWLSGLSFAAIPAAVLGVIVAGVLCCSDGAGDPVPPRGSAASPLPSPASRDREPAGSLAAPDTPTTSTTLTMPTPAPPRPPITSPSTDPALATTPSALVTGSKPSPKSTPTIGHVYVMITSTPSGADIALGARVLGKAPLRVPLPRGNRDVKLVLRCGKDYQPSTIVVHTDGLTKQQHVTLVLVAHDQVSNPFDD